MITAVDRRDIRARARNAMRTCVPAAWMVTLITIFATDWVGSLYERLNPVSNQFQQTALERMQAFSQEAANLTDPAAINNLMQYQMDAMSLQLRQLIQTPAGKATVMGSILITLFATVVNYGYSGYSLKAVRLQPTSWSEPFSRFYMAGKIILAELLQGVLIALWSMLFVVPGLIAFYRYRMIRYCLLDDPGCSVLEAFRRSRAMMRGRALELFFLDVPFVLMAFFGEMMIAYLIQLAGVQAPLNEWAVLAGISAFYCFLNPYRSFSYALWYIAIRPRDRS